MIKTVLIKHFCVCICENIQQTNGKKEKPQKIYMVYTSIHSYEILLRINNITNVLNNSQVFSFLGAEMLNFLNFH